MAKQPEPADAAPEAADAQREEERKKRSLRAEVARRRETLRRHEAERKLPGQILLIVFNSLGTGVIVSMITALVMSQLPTKTAFAEPELGKLILIMSFLLSFLVALLFLMRRLPENWWQLANEYAKSERYQAPKEKWGGMLAAKAHPDYAPLFDMDRPSSYVPPTLEGNAHDAPFDHGAKTGGEDTAASGEPQALFSDNAKSPDDAAPEAAPDALEQAKAQAVAEIERFAAAVAEAAQSAKRSVDAVGRFALQLYLAGACSACARKFMLSARDAVGILVRGLMQIGANRAFAESFAGNVEEFAQRDAYRGAINAGQSAMERQLRGEAAIAAAGAAATLEDWSAPQRKSLVPRVVTFVVTDIVDASGLSQRLGNLHTQRVIKAHDEAVLKAMESNRGTKVRHTGDGIIATFPDPARALAAAQSIQQRLEEHNKRMPHLSANVRIAINAGEAIEDAGSFFGTAVKMTAQLCEMAKAGQILAGDVIRSFCKSSTQAFSPFGEIAVPASDKMKTVYEVSWAKSGTRVEYGDIGHPAG